MKKKKNMYKPKRHKNLVKNIFSVLLTLIAASFFVVIGYSVAKPFGEIGESKNDDSSFNVIDTLETYDKELDSIQKGIKAYWIRDTEIKDIASLKTLLNGAGKEYNSVVVPLKIEGGMLNYSSSNEEAVLAEAVNTLSLSEIVDTIKSNGYTPIASINTMQDNIYPKTNKSAGFLVKSTNTLWLDSNAKDKGKPWLDPASSATKSYLTSITGEISQAGFEKIICTNVEYPAFSETAFESLDESVRDSNRYLNLIDVVNSMNKAAKNKGSDMMIEIPAYEMLIDNCEVFQPILLNTSKYIIRIDLSEFNKVINCNGEKIDFTHMTISEKIETICKKTEEKIYKTSFIPEITSLSFNLQQKADILSTFEKLEYESFIIR